MTAYHPGARLIGRILTCIAPMTTLALLSNIGLIGA